MENCLIFSRLKALPAYQLVRDAIEQEIISGRIQIGSQLPTEGKLAEQFQVNRSTVREGIRLLEQSGLVRRKGGKRLYASLPHYRELATRLSRALVLQQVNFLELWQTAMVLEPATAHAAAQWVTPAQIAALEDNIRRTEETLLGGQSIVGLDIAFHAMVSEAAHNRVLLLAREPMSLLFYPSLEVLLDKLPRAGQRLLDAHKRILEALKRHDAAMAGEWMTKHIVDFRRGYLMVELDMEKPVEQLSVPPNEN
jgi:GntR family transcriptional regulator, transcriptional repressor for pyruvate dehydrogenase complex